jgi:hypothetical protein
MSTRVQQSRSRCLLASASAAATCLLVVAAAGPGSGRPSIAEDAQGSPISVAGCPAFPANNYWNADISQLPVNARSAQWTSHMSPGAHLHPDFGPSFGEQPVPYGIPVTIVDSSHPTVDITFDYADESDHVPYPFGADTKIEGGRASDGDRHAVVVDKTSCRLYETYATYVHNGAWSAGSGATWHLRSNQLRPDGWTSADAAGLPILPGLLRYHEVEVTGAVNHAIRFTTNITDQRHIWPARHDAGSVADQAYPPMGARFRLQASFSLAGYRPDTVVVLKAMKKYGLVLADNGSPWYFQGDAVAAWPSGLLDELKTIPASAFVAVDTAPLEISPNSGAANPVG